MHITRKTLVLLAAVMLCGAVASSATASPIFFFDANTPYLSTADIPSGFYLGGSPTALENFEDGTLGFGITASDGSVIPPGFDAFIDSVDADDGAIDGSGSKGHSWFFGSGSIGVIFTFSGPLLPTAAALVWTDGGGTTTFEAFGPGMVSLGTIGPVSIADGSITGTTAEDRFFGVQDLNGIQAIKVSNTSGGIEVDHVQYGVADITGASTVPEPSSVVLLGLGTFGLLCGRWRKRRLLLPAQ